MTGAAPEEPAKGQPAAVPSPGDGAAGETRPRLAGTFAAGADRYERLRPTHPLEAVRFCVPLPSAEVVDVGAGTGKLTRSLLDEGHRVTAIEPSAAMRRVLLQQMPGIRVLDTAAERTGLPANSADVVTFGQSWHWVDVPAASAELERILRPQGWVSMLWSMLDDSVPWVARVQDAMHSTTRAWQRTPGVREQAWERAPQGDFGPAERHTVSWSAALSTADVVAMVTTRSYYLEGTPQEQRGLVERVRRAVALEHSAASHEAPLMVPYVTTCLRYRHTG